MKSAKEIVAEAWHITVEHRNVLFRFGFIPSFFSILVTGWYVFYQVQAFRYSPFFSEEHSDFLIPFLLKVLDILGADSRIMTLSIILLIFILLGWFFAPMLCQGAIAHLVAQARSGRKMERGFFNAFFRFFPLLEITVLKRGMQPVSFFTEFSFVGRHLPGTVPLVSPILIFFVVLGLIVLFFCSFTTQAIILRDMKFTGAIGMSFRVVVENFAKTLKILVLFLLVELRVLVNILVVFTVPIVVVSVTGLFAQFLSDQAGIIIAIVILIVLVLMAAYLTGILFVFSEAIWTIAFLEFIQIIDEKDADDKELRKPIGETASYSSSIENS